MKRRRGLEDVLRCGGECRDEEEISMLLETTLRMLSAAADKRDACGLLAAPARMRLPVRARRLRRFAGGDGA